ncbi:inner membrane protein [Halobellus clavatus]|uniref:Inner membrane protein n=1 Tax=Halobellus clavatus TaxID=660517 RepID=A0A1H3IKR6_9EURY|nr:inner membrane protein [Halobellus clavatus]
MPSSPVRVLLCARSDDTDVYRKGHYGVSLLVFAPIAFVLLSFEQVDLAVITGAVMLWLAMLPDVDHRVPGIAHRGPTHSLAFAALVGAAFGGAGVVLSGALGDPLTGVAFVGGVSVGVLGFSIGALTVVAHLLGDALTPAGVNFLWPLSGRTYSLSLWTADNTVANYGLFAVGIFATGAGAYLGVAL